MAPPYTINQKGALASVFAAAVWGRIVTHFVLVDYVKSASPIETVEVIAWIIVLLYAIRVRWSYIVGIVGVIYVLFIDLSIYIWYSGAGQWWTVTDPVETILHGFLYLIAISCIYFSYIAYKELI